MSIKTVFVKIEITISNFEDKQFTRCSPNCSYNDSGSYCQLFDADVYAVDVEGNIEGNIRCAACVDGEII